MGPSRARWATPIAVAFALLLPAAASARQLISYDFARDRLVAFDSAAPGTLTAEFTIDDGPDGGFLDIDVRPATGVIYGLGVDNVLYTISRTGAAAPVGVLPAPTQAGAYRTIDFNPVVDRLRVVSDKGDNLRVNPDTAATTVDTPLQYAAGDPNAGTAPTVTSIAYTNNAPGAATTTLYDIDSALDVLAIQAPPNAGTLSTVGGLSTDFARGGGFDITPAPQQAFALTGQFEQTLRTIDLASGAATSALPASGVLRGLTAPRPGEDLTACSITGTPGDDVLNGSNGPDTICGLGGNDRIKGGRGRDLLIGGPGNDQLFGGDDPDELRGGEGNDRLLGEGARVNADFDDTLYGGPGADSLSGGFGGDYLFGEEGDDRIAGDEGVDRLFGAAGRDHLDGGVGPDIAAGGEDADVVRGGDANDIVSGDEGNDLVDGGGQMDEVQGGAGADRVFGGGGADIVSGGEGRDVIDSGVGDDAVFAADSPALRDDISCGSGTDTLQRDTADLNPANCNP